MKDLCVPHPPRALGQAPGVQCGNLGRALRGSQTSSLSPGGLLLSGQQGFWGRDRPGSQATPTPSGGPPSGLRGPLPLLHRGLS